MFLNFLFVVFFISFCIFLFAAMSLLFTDEHKYGWVILQIIPIWLIILIPLSYFGTIHIDKFTSKDYLYNKNDTAIYLIINGNMATISDAKSYNSFNKNLPVTFVETYRYFGLVFDSIVVKEINCKEDVLKKKEEKGK